MSDLDGPGLAAVIGAVGVALVGLLTLMGKAAKWVIDLLLKEAKAALKAKNAELSEVAAARSEATKLARNDTDRN